MTSKKLVRIEDCLQTNNPPYEVGTFVFSEADRLIWEISSAEDGSIFASAVVGDIMSADGTIVASVEDIWKFAFCKETIDDKKLEMQVHEKDNEIQTLKNKLSEKDNEIQTLKNKLSEKDGEMAKLKDALTLVECSLRLIRDIL